MSVILEFTVDGDQFSLGRVLSGPPDMQLELERIIPTGPAVLPFVWATGKAFDAFEEKVRDSPLVRGLIELDRVDDSALYRIEWEDPGDDLIAGIAAADATVLEARGDDGWQFRLRFPDHEGLSSFYDYCTENDISIHVERTYTLSAEAGRRRRFDLSREQREALVLALRRGYFATPSEATLEELAAELDISPQALSNRIRRGTEQVLEKALRSSLADRPG